MPSTKVKFWDGKEYQAQELDAVLSGLAEYAQAHEVLVTRYKYTLWRSIRNNAESALVNFPLVFCVWVCLGTVVVLSELVQGRGISVVPIVLGVPALTVAFGGAIYLIMFVGTCLLSPILRMDYPVYSVSDGVVVGFWSKGGTLGERLQDCSWRFGTSWRGVAGGWTLPRQAVTIYSCRSWLFGFRYKIVIAERADHVAYWRALLTIAGTPTE